jgi:hypothetical protein
VHESHFLQARLVSISRFSVNYVPRAGGDAELVLTRRIDELYLSIHLLAP